MRRSPPTFFSVGLVLIFLVCLFPSSFPSILATAGGGVVLNEISYNPIGSDTNHEWIEVWNNSAVTIDLTGWKLYEASTNHGLTVYQGTFNIVPNGYAVLTASGSIFLNDHPGFVGTVIDTTFSLSNTGETISLKDTTGSAVDTIIYSSSQGADGNGKTLERNHDGIFVESMIDSGTPGEQNSVINNPANDNANNINQNGNENSNGNTNENLNNNENDNINGNSNSSVEGNNNINENSNSIVLLAPGDLLVNEVFPVPSSNSNSNEWIELYNNSNSPIDLSFLTIEDNVADPKPLGGLVSPFSYVVLDPSPISLNNDGDIVLIKNREGTVIDQMQYGNFNNNGNNAPKPSYNQSIIQSIGRYPNLQDTGIDKDDFKAFGNPTKGSENIVNNHPPVAIITVQYPYKTSGKAPFSFNVTGEQSYDIDGDSLSYVWSYGDGGGSMDENPLSYKYYVPDNYMVRLTVTDNWGAYDTAKVYVTVEASSTGGGASSTPTCNTRETLDYILLSEVLPNPIGPDSENEFIEIVNKDAKDVNLCNWKLDDKEGGSPPYTIRSDLILRSGEYRVFMVTETKITLNNDEDDVRIIDPNGKIVDSIHYTHPPEGKSYARVKVKQASLQPRFIASSNIAIGYEEQYAWEWDSPTPGEDNDTPVEFKGVIINELFPNPIGTDTEREFIELYNTSSQSVDLNGWSLSDESGTQFTFSEETILENGMYLAIPYVQSKITLNNDTDTVQLNDNLGRLQDEITYENGGEGMSYSRFVNNPSYLQDSDWEWVPPTQGAENKRESLSVWADPPGGQYEGSMTVSLLTNKQGAKIFYSFSGEATPDEQFEYIKPILLNRSTELWFWAFTSETDVTQIKNERYTITPPSNVTSGPIIISEIYPNPEGKDAGNEWIELRNIAHDPISLLGWYITNKNKKKMALMGEHIILPNEYYVFTTEGADFSFVNTTDTITLFTQSGEIADRLSYGNVAIRQSIIRLDKDGIIYNIATPTDFPTPALENIDRILTTRENDPDRDQVVSDVELASHLNPNLFDTDGDTLPDGFELWIGSNPLIKDVTAEKKEKYMRYLSMFFTVYAYMQDNVLKLKGKSIPLGTISLTLTPQSSSGSIISLQDHVSAEGMFSVDIMQSLMKGIYAVQAWIKDKQSVTSTISSEFLITLHEDYTPAQKEANKKSAKLSLKSPGHQIANTINSTLNNNTNLNSDNYAVNYNENISVNSGPKQSVPEPENNIGDLATDIVSNNLFSYQLYFILGFVLFVFLVLFSIIIHKKK